MLLPFAMQNIQTIEIVPAAKLRLGSSTYIYCAQQSKQKKLADRDRRRKRKIKRYQISIKKDAQSKMNWCVFLLNLSLSLFLQMFIVRFNPRVTLHNIALLFFSIFYLVLPYLAHAICIISKLVLTINFVYRISFFVSLFSEFSTNSVFSRVLFFFITP